MAEIADTQEILKSVQNSLDKTTGLLIKSVEGQAAVNEVMVQKIKDRLDSIYKAEEDDDDERKEETKKSTDGVDGLHLTDDTKGTLPNDDGDSDKAEYSEEPSTDAATDKVQIEEKQVEELRKKYPGLEINVRGVETVEKVHTPPLSQVMKHAPEVAANSSFKSEMAAMEFASTADGAIGYGGPCGRPRHSTASRHRHDACGSTLARFAICSVARHTLRNLFRGITCLKLLILARDGFDSF